jgi:hypothetical protein
MTIALGMSSRADVGVSLLRLATDARSDSGPGTTAGWSYITVGVVLPLLLARTPRDRFYALLAVAVAAVAVGAVGFLLDSLFLI